MEYFFSEAMRTPEKLAYPGQIVTHVFTIANQGTNSDVYSLDVALPEGWSVLGVPASLSVAAGGQEIVFANLSVPATAGAGLYQVVMRASSTSAPSVTAEVAARVQVQAVTDFDLVWEQLPARARPGVRVDGSIRVTNLGNTPDTYRIELSTRPQWEARIIEQEIRLLPGEGRILDFYVLVPKFAAAGTRYSVNIIVESARDPSLSHLLSTTNTLGPPRPEMVGGTLFPEWEMRCRFSIDEDRDPKFTFTGSGDIPLFGDLYASLAMGMSGVERAHARLFKDGWGVYLGSGSIAGAFLGISGWPLFAFGLDQINAGARVLFTESAKGFSADWGSQACGFGVINISDLSEGFSVQEGWWSYDFDGLSYVKGLLSQAEDQTGSGTAFKGSATLSLDGLALSVSYIEVPPGYPKESQRTGCSISADCAGCPFPISGGWSYKKSVAGIAPNTFAIVEQGVNVTASLLSRDMLSMSLSGSVRVTKSNDSPVSTNDYSYSLSESVGGTVAPFSWHINGGLTHTGNRVTGVTTSSQNVGVMGKLNLDSIQAGIDFSLKREATIAGITDEWDLSCSLRLADLLFFPEVRVTPEVTLSVDEAGSMLGLSLAGTIPPDASFMWTSELSLGEECTFSIALSVNFSGIFPFCGPIKGRVSGHVFIDANGNGLRDAADLGMENVLLLIDGREAMTNSDGLFVFRPLMPGRYKLGIDDLPMGVRLGVPLPIYVSIRAGEEIQVEIPLSPQSWITGFVFNDANHNGERNAGEAGVGGVAVRISGEGMQQTLRTNNVGQFGMQLSPGQYSVVLLVNTLPERFEPTTTSRVGVVALKQATAKVSFGVYKKPRPVVVTFGPPTAAFTFTPDQPSVGDTLSLDGSQSSAINADIASYQWEITIDDKQITALGRRVKIVLDRPGMWRVRLTVIDSKGLKAMTERMIEVQP